MIDKGQRTAKRKPSPALQAPEAASGSVGLAEADEFDQDRSARRRNLEDTSGRIDLGLMSVRESVSRLITDFRVFSKCSEAEQRLQLLGQMQESVKSLRSTFLSADLPHWGKLTSAVSTLLFATAKKPGGLTFSATRTLAGALELLTEVVTLGSRGRGTDTSPLSLLVVLPDPAERKSLVTAIQGQGVKVSECEDSTQAIERLVDQPFDVVFSDLLLPDVEASAFVAELRKLPFHHSTPIVLVATLADFTARSRSDPQGSGDFVAKPIVSSELVVKAFTFGLRQRMDSADGAPPTAKPSATPASRKPAPELGDSPFAARRGESPSKVSVESGRSAGQADDALLLAQQELAKRTLQAKQAQERAAEIEKSWQLLSAELKTVLEREADLKHNCSSLGQRLEAATQALAEVRAELVEENQRRLAAEQQASQQAQTPTRVQKDLAARTVQAQQAQQRVAELEKNSQSLNTDLKAALRREAQLKHECGVWERRVESADRALAEARQELSQESQQRLGAEQQAAQAGRRLLELTRAEAAARQQLDQQVRDRAEESARAQAALRKEAAAHQDARQAAAEALAARAKLEKQIAEAQARAQKARERAASFDRTRKQLEAGIRELLERQAQLDQHSSALDQHLETLEAGLKQKGA